METNQITLTVDVSTPAIAEAVTNLITLMSGSEPAKRAPRVTPPKKEGAQPNKAAATKVAAKEEKKAEPAKKAEAEPDVRDETEWTLDLLKVRVPAIGKASREANKSLRSKMNEMGVKTLNKLDEEGVKTFGAYVEELEKEHGVK